MLCEQNDLNQKQVLKRREKKISFRKMRSINVQKSCYIGYYLSNEWSIKTNIVKTLFIKVAFYVLFVLSFLSFFSHSFSPERLKTILWTTTVSTFNSFSGFCASLNTLVFRSQHSCHLYYSLQYAMKINRKNTPLFMCALLSFVFGLYGMVGWDADEEPHFKHYLHL